ALSGTGGVEDRHAITAGVRRLYVVNRVKRICRVEDVPAIETPLVTQRRRRRSHRERDIARRDDELAGGMRRDRRRGAGWVSPAERGHGSQPVRGVVAITARADALERSSCAIRRDGPGGAVVVADFIERDPGSVVRAAEIQALKFEQLAAVLQRAAVGAEDGNLGGHIVFGAEGSG